jgi:hypothetical protein
LLNGLSFTRAMSPLFLCLGLDFFPDSLFCTLFHLSISLAVIVDWLIHNSSEICLYISKTIYNLFLQLCLPITWSLALLYKFCNWLVQFQKEVLWHLSWWCCSPGYIDPSHLVSQVVDYRHGHCAQLLWDFEWNFNL